MIINRISILFLLLSLPVPLRADCLSSSDVRLEAWWPGDGDAEDHSGNGHHGQWCVNAPNYECPIEEGSYVQGQDEEAFWVSPNNSGNPGKFVKVPDDTNELGNLESFSLAFWMKSKLVTNNWQSVLLKGYPRDSWSWGVHQNNNRIYYGFNGCSLFASRTIVFDRWDHMTMTYDHAANILALYVNGVLDNSRPCNVNPPHRGILGFGNKGGNPGGWSWNGVLDEVALFNAALDASEVWDLYEAGICKVKLPCEHSSEVFTGIGACSVLQLQKEGKIELDRTGINGNVCIAAGAEFKQKSQQISGKVRLEPNGTHCVEYSDGDLDSRVEVDDLSEEIIFAWEELTHLESYECTASYDNSESDSEEEDNNSLPSLLDSDAFNTSSHGMAVICSEKLEMKEHTEIRLTGGAPFLFKVNKFEMEKGAKLITEGELTLSQVVVVASDKISLGSSCDEADGVLVHATIVGEKVELKGATILGHIIAETKLEADCSFVDNNCGDDDGAAGSTMADDTVHQEADREYHGK